jgi:hypothetical protein
MSSISYTLSQFRRMSRNLRKKMGCRGDHGARACDPAPASLQTRNPQYCKRAIPWDIGEQTAAQILLVKPLRPCRTGGIIGIPWELDRPGGQCSAALWDDHGWCARQAGLSDGKNECGALSPHEQRGRPAATNGSKTMEDGITLDGRGVPGDQ